MNTRSNILTFISDIPYPFSSFSCGYDLKIQKMLYPSDSPFSRLFNPKLRPSMLKLLNNRRVSLSNYKTASYNMQRNIFDATYHQAREFWSQDLLGHYCSVNAINLSPAEDMLVSAEDDGRLLLWNLHNQLHANSNEDNLQPEELIDNYHYAFNSAVFTCTGKQVSSLKYSLN